MKKRYLLFILLIPAAIFCQNFGKISGKVTDLQTGEELVGANVIVVGSNIGAATDANGFFVIAKLKPGTYKLQASFIGYAKQVKDNITVKAGGAAAVDFKLKPEEIKAHEIVAIAEMPALQGVSMSAVRVVNGKTGYEGFLNHNTEEYSLINENNFKDALKNPLSTFSVDVDAASYSNVRRFINEDQMPYKDAVRVEELINYFDYNYKAPDNGDPLKINSEYSECPWNKDHKLLLIGLQSKKLERSETKPSNLTFLLDVSGSMDDPKKLPLLQRSFKMLVEQLKDDDIVTIIVYAGAAGMVLQPTPGSQKTKIIDAIEGLRAGGSTAGGEGIKLAYKKAKENFIRGGNNRVILATDGDFNVGISSTSELVRFIQSQKESGIFLTVLGFGYGNYKDNRLQELADKGNGNHAYIDNIMEAKKIFLDEMNATLYTVAKDVKIQVEFNPYAVKSYRLIGYENRMLNAEDFKDDQKDAGEIGAGHRVTALYEIVPNESGKVETPNDLKYQESNLKNSAKDCGDLLTLKIRYKKPDGKTSREISEVLTNNCIDLVNASENFKLASAVAEFGMLLRDSEYKGNSSFAGVLKLAASTIKNDKFGYRKEFVTIVEKSSLLYDKKE